MKKQRGFGPGEFIVAIFLLVVGALLAFKLLPPYIEYYMIQQTFKKLAASPELRGANRKEIATAFNRHATIENISAIAGDDIDFSKNGVVITLSARYQVKVPLIANIALLFDFNPTSAPN